MGNFQGQCRVLRLRYLPGGEFGWRGTPATSKRRCPKTCSMGLKSPIEHKDKCLSKHLAYASWSENVALMIPVGFYRTSDRNYHRGNYLMAIEYP